MPAIFLACGPLAAIVANCPEALYLDETDAHVPLMKRKLRPRQDYVVVQLEEDPRGETLSPGGIVLLPPKEEPRQSIGRVIAVGPGTYHGKVFVPTTVKFGDRVAFSKYGHATPPNEPMLRIFHEQSIHYVCDP